MEGPTRIGEILGGRQTQADSSRREALSSNNFATPQQAKDIGLHFRNQPPKPAVCEYCGRELQPVGVVMGGEIFFLHPFFPRCTCKQAQAYWEEQDKKAAERRAMEEKEKHRAAMQRKIQRLLMRSGIKRRFQQRTFQTFRQDTPGRAKAYRIAKEYADNFPLHQARGDGLYIEGTNGTGKTHLAAAIALQLISQGIPVICKTSSDLLLDIKKSFDSADVHEGDVLDIYKQVDLLIIDDLGKEQCSDWSMSTLYSILNDRYEDMKPTIVTTNYNADGLVKALAPKGFDDTKIVAIISRLRETSTVMTMAWADIRGREDVQA